MKRIKSKLYLHRFFYLVRLYCIKTVTIHSSFISICNLACYLLHVLHSGDNISSQNPLPIDEPHKFQHPLNINHHKDRPLLSLCLAARLAQSVTLLCQIEKGRGSKSPRGKPAGGGLISSNLGK